MTQAKRFFEVTITDKWIETTLYFLWGNNHEDVAKQLELKNKRVFNSRYREIEKTGKYYMVREAIKGGKCFVFEITSI